jgi:hypothetical protein
LSVDAFLVVQGSALALASESTDITTLTVLILQDSSLALSADPVGFVQAHGLSAQGSLFGLTTGTVSIHAVSYTPAPGRRVFVQTPLVREFKITRIPVP